MSPATRHIACFDAFRMLSGRVDAARKLSDRVDAVRTASGRLETGVLVLLVFGWMGLQPILLAHTAHAQQINFSLTVEEGILAEPIQNLSFNEKEPVISNGDLVSVELVNEDFNALGVIEIIAASEYEIDVIIDFPSELMPPGERFDQIQTVPVSYRWAYNNASESACNASALENSHVVPDGFSTARFAVRPHTGATPGLPPAPMHGGILAPEGNPGGGEFRREASIVCLYIGGEIDVPNVPSDTYSSDVQIEIRYSNNLSSR